MAINKTKCCLSTNKKSENEICKEIIRNRINAYKQLAKY